MRDRDFWNEQYETGAFLERWDYAHPSQELVATVAGLPSRGTALDVGCGAGREAIFLARAGFRSIGVDWSEAALVRARACAAEAGVCVDWRAGSALALPLEDGSVDLANDRGCFHLIEEGDRPKYAAELARVLRRGARFLLRGCRRPDFPPFTSVTEAVVDRHFGGTFSRGAVLEIELVSDSGTLPSNVVILERR